MFSSRLLQEHYMLHYVLKLLHQLYCTVLQPFCFICVYTENLKVQELVMFKNHKFLFSWHIEHIVGPDRKTSSTNM